MSKSTGRSRAPASRQPVRRTHNRRDCTWHTLGLFHAEFFAFAIKHEPLAGDEPNLQHRPRAFVLGLRDAVNEGIAFEYCRPHGREIISLAYQLCTQLRQVVCSLFCHQTMPVQPFTLSIDLNQSVGRNENGLRRNRRRVGLGCGTTNAWDEQ
jgi:hypothetical protein